MREHTGGGRRLASGCIRTTSHVAGDGSGRAAAARCLAGRSTHAGGAAIPLILLVLLALTGLGHAALLVGLEEEAASTASVAVLQARLMAEGGVRRALRTAQADTLSPWPEGGSVLAQETTPQGSYRVAVRPLTRELHLMEGVGAAPLAPDGPQRVTDRVSRLLWSLSPVERLRAWGAVVEYGGGVDLAPGAIDTQSLFERGEHPSPAGCLDLGAALDSVSSGRSVVEMAPALDALGGRLPALGFLEHDSLLARVPGRILGTVTPGPVAEGARCLVDAADNWGSPLDPGGPCGGRRPALVAEGDLTLSGGEGQGLLLVTGNLRITNGAHFAGLVLVGGDLTLDGGAQLHGLASVAGRVRVAGAAGVSGAFCPALLALHASPGLRRPLLLPGSGWIRPL